MSMGPLYVLFGEVFIHVFAHFLIDLFVLLALSCISSLYILEIKPLPDVSLEKMFSRTMGSLFILLMVSLAV